MKYLQYITVFNYFLKLKKCQHFCLFVFIQLQKHDKNMTTNSPGLRTDKEMAEEAEMMRNAFTQ